MAAKGRFVRLVSVAAWLDLFDSAPALVIPPPGPRGCGFDPTTDAFTCQSEASRAEAAVGDQAPPSGRAFSRSRIFSASSARTPRSRTP